MAARRSSQIPEPRPPQNSRPERGARSGGWRRATLWQAAAALGRVGGIDLAASLAYYTLLSIFPFMALLVVALSAFFSRDAIRDQLAVFLLIYFPASHDFLELVVDELFNARPVISLIAFVGMMLGANGLFMAVNRSVNRVFGCPPPRLLDRALLQVALAVSVMALFIASIVASGLFQLVINLGEAATASSGAFGALSSFIATLLFGFAPPVVTATAFLAAYRVVPSRPARWPDATFGALAAAFLFEAAKWGFFWFGNAVTQRSLLYGPVSSVIILLVWSHIAGLIFLFGASIAAQASSFRPQREAE